MLFLKPVIAAAAVFGFAITGALADEWYVLGLQDRWTYNINPGAGGGTIEKSYWVGAIEMNSKNITMSKGSGGTHNEQDICGAVFWGSTVECYGEVAKRCQDYGVVKFRSRSCRAFCPNIGDYSPVYLVTGQFGLAQANSMICDRKL